MARVVAMAQKWAVPRQLLGVGRLRLKSQDGTQ